MAIADTTQKYFDKFLEWDTKLIKKFQDRFKLSDYKMLCISFAKGFIIGASLLQLMTDDRIKSLCYTKDEVDKMISDAVAEARAIDEASMAKHNRDATVISMILGFTALALFVDGLLRMLGIIEPFMGIDINIIDQIVDKVKVEMLPLKNILNR